MQKIREWLIKLQDQTDLNTRRLDKYDGIIDWIVKLIIGTILLAILGLILVSKNPLIP